MNNSDKIIHDEIKRRLNEQSESIKSIDTKAALILSFVGAILAGLVNSNWFNGLGTSYHVMILLPFGLASIAALASLLVRSYRSDPEPKNLIENYKNKTEEQTRGQLTKNYEDAYAKNEPKVKNKAKLSKAAFVLLAIATIVIIVAILITPNSSKGDNKWQMTRHQRQPIHRLNQ